MRKDPLKKIEKLKASIERACLSDERFKDLTPVMGEGQVPSPLMVIGEAPGREETRLGIPFVGRAGSFFTSVLRETLGMEREVLYITNVVKVWPTIDTKRLKTRKPTGEEEEFFMPFLMEEIRAVAPKVILAVGRTAFGALVPHKPFIPGRWESFEGVPLMPVYHPSYLLRKQKSLAENRKALERALLEVKKRLA